MENLQHFVYDHLLSSGMSESFAKYGNMIALLIVLLSLVILTDFVIRKIVARLFTKFANTSKTNFDDLLIANK